MHTASAKPSLLWAACVLPGYGPEYRFTAAPPRNPILALHVRLCAYRARREVTL